MTTEQKAKAYDEVVNKLRRFMEQGINPLITRADVQDFFPELQEGEGEKIKKYILNFVNLNKGVNLSPDDADKMIAWIEKQGEQKHTNKEYTFNAIPRLLEMIQPTDRAKSYCQKLIDSLEQEGYSADAKIVRERLKLMNGEKVAMATMDEQKHTGNVSEWSVEDKVKLNRIVTCLENLNVADNDILLKDVAWLLSLKDRVQSQPKQEWSERDKEEFQIAIDTLVEAGQHDSAQWLKSLNPQPHWKPSEDQMTALAEALSLAKNCGEDWSFDLRTLHEQLKKL